MIEQKTHLSASFINSMMLRCQAEKMAVERGEIEFKKTDAILVGGYVDAYFNGTLDSYIDENKNDLLTNKGELYAKFKHCNTIIEFAKADPVMMRYLSGEHQRKVSGTIGDVEFVGFLDSYYADTAIVELKVVNSIRKTTWNEETRQRENFIQSSGYARQLAIYRELIRQETGKTLPCYIAALSTETVPDKEIIWMPEWSLDIALDEVIEFAENASNIRRGIVQPTRCERCDYCKSTRQLVRPISYDVFCG